VLIIVGGTWKMLLGLWRDSNSPLKGVRPIREQFVCVEGGGIVCISKPPIKRPPGATGGPSFPTHGGRGVDRAGGPIDVPF